MAEGFSSFTAHLVTLLMFEIDRVIGVTDLSIERENLMMQRRPRWIVAGTKLARLSSRSRRCAAK